jgi:hypothetical protein
MKALIAALALVTLLAAPSFAGPGEIHYNVSPATSDFNGNGN